jgi:hypothetical protein
MHVEQQGELVGKHIAMANLLFLHRVSAAAEAAADDPRKFLQPLIARNPRVLSAGVECNTTNVSQGGQPLEALSFIHSLTHSVDRSVGNMNCNWSPIQRSTK